MLGLTNGCLVKERSFGQVFRFEFRNSKPFVRSWTLWNIQKIYKDREADILMMNENDINYYWREFCTRYEVYLGRIEEI